MEPFLLGQLAHPGIQRKGAQWPTDEGRWPLASKERGTESWVEMFVYYYVHLDRAVEEAERVVSRLLEGMSEAAEIAYREGEELRMKAGIRGRTPAKTVRLEVGPTVHVNGEAAVPLTWEATGVSGLFPRMEGELILAPLGPGNTQISFRGTYKPPLGAVGEVLDRALLHRVAEATVKNFVDRVRDAIADWPLWQRSPRDAELKMTDAG